MRVLTPETIAPPFGAYSHGVLLVAKKLVITSGQLGIRRDGSVPDTVEKQAEICFANIEAILREGGLSRKHVLRLNAFVTARDHMAGYMAVRDRWLTGSILKPASTLMVVSGFTRPEFLVEIEAIAGES